jgi:predicted enzyme related to lactoylglutathione lyase
MGSSIYSVTIDCADPPALASFWADVLDYERTHEEDELVAIEPRDKSGSALLFLRVPDDKKVKNRLHLDLKPTDQDAEVERVKALGATEVDIGQGDVSWVVLADPEGNEFCILRPR